MPEWVITVERTCQIEGTIATYCVVCGEVARSASITKLPHQPSGEWVVLEKALCNKEGRQVQYCLLCGEAVLSEAIPALTGADHVFYKHVLSGSVLIPPIVSEEICEICGFTTEAETSWSFAWVPLAILAALIALIIIAANAQKKNMKNNAQPAQQSYFFGPGYSDMAAAIRALWLLNARTAQDYHERSEDKGFVSLRGVFWFVCALSVVTFGTVFFVAISAFMVSFLMVFFIIVYLGFSLAWLVDRAYLLKNRIFTACNECKEKSLIPAYICDRCGAKHTNLTPGVYGILKRRCNCGHVLPSTAFNGRNKLKAVCANCGSDLYDRESVPICIPIVGGRSVGKTAFITAFSKDFIDNVAPAKGWTTAFYSQAKSQIFDDIIADYQKGGTRMTDRPLDISKTSSVSFSFFVGGKAFRPDRLVHVYDIAGEVFTDDDENEMQKQYEYCQGIVFIIDPFAITSVRHKYEEELTPEDLAGIGEADINGIVNTFINKLRNVTGLSDRKMMRVPLAVVISKTDSASLAAEFSAEKIDALIAAHPARNISRFDALDRLCREFLAENYMEAFLNVIDIKFKNNRFFTCSAIGHTRDAGQYEPQGVMEPMEWLFQQADRKMKQTWKDNSFTKNPKRVFQKT
jgi:GTPase SAR1 family protein